MSNRPKERPTWMTTIFVAVALLMILSLPEPLGAATRFVGIYDNYFNPTNLTITVGDTVTWHNYGTNFHSTTSTAPTPEWDSPLLDTGEEYSHPFNGIGNFPYADYTHYSSMRGTIIVETVGNRPPTVSVTNPVAGATFLAPTNLLIQATASDSDGTVARVEFFANANSLGVVANPPFRVVASNLTAGFYGLTAVATDNGNASATSSVATVTVKPILINPTRLTSSQFQLTLTGVTPTKTNILYASTNLQTWTPINTNRPFTSVTNLVDSAATNRYRFYRIMQLP